MFKILDYYDYYDDGINIENCANELAFLKSK